MSRHDFHGLRSDMATYHEHNLRQPLPAERPFGIRVRLRRSDPLRNLLGSDWTKEHWFASRDEREVALEQMSGRYLYFRPGDAPSLEFERLDP
jgi:hypothetical protein